MPQPAAAAWSFFDEPRPSRPRPQGTDLGPGDRLDLDEPAIDIVELDLRASDELQGMYFLG